MKRIEVQLLVVMQVTWHPESHAHFAVLASDNVLRLYHVDHLSAPASTILVPRALVLMLRACLQ